MECPIRLKISLEDLSKMLDHSLLHPTLTDDDVLAGLHVSKKYNVATACVKPYHILFAKKHLQGTSVVVCPVISFPHGSATAEVKIFEARRAVEEGGKEIEMVVNIGRVLSGKWEYVKNEIRLVNEAVVDAGAILTVVFETQYLSEGQIIKLCGICSEVGVAYVQTSVGYAQLNGVYSSKEASSPYLHLIKKHITPRVKIKVSQGVQTLDDLLRARALGVSRVATVATTAILDEALRRGIGKEPIELVLPGSLDELA